MPLGAVGTSGLHFRLQFRERAVRNVRIADSKQVGFCLLCDSKLRGYGLLYIVNERHDAELSPYLRRESVLVLTRLFKRSLLLLLTLLLLMLHLHQIHFLIRRVTNAIKRFPCGYNSDNKNTKQNRTCTSFQTLVKRRFRLFLKYPTPLHRYHLYELLYFRN